MGDRQDDHPLEVLSPRSGQLVWNNLTQRGSSSKLILSLAASAEALAITGQSL